ncbi:hypothetical protein DL93DRAFT_111853 [Clavulina sp. PMI_390]|nr:hypothetical protein DL93DRAFT_111853 [Clavulina sp. PMI_390]
MPTLERAYAPQQVLDSMPRWAGASAWLKAVTQPPLDAVAQILHACYRDVLALPAPEEGGEPETASTPAASQWKFDIHLADYPFDETQGFTTLAWSSNKVVDVDTDPDLARVNGMRLDVDVRCFIFVFSPWMMNTLDFKNFILQRSISSRPRPRGTEQVELTQSDKIWAVINDRCARFNCDYFIITTVDEWAFGCFSQERTTAFITHTIRSSSTGPAGLEPDSSVSVMEAATFWLASSLGAPGGWEIDQVPNEEKSTICDRTPLIVTSNIPLAPPPSSPSPSQHQYSSDVGRLPPMSESSMSETESENRDAQAIRHLLGIALTPENIQAHQDALNQSRPSPVRPTAGVPAPPVIGEGGSPPPPANAYIVNATRVGSWQDLAKRERAAEHDHDELASVYGSVVDGGASVVSTMYPEDSISLRGFYLGPKVPADTKSQTSGAGPSAMRDVR